ncbi:hypothetical protein SASPL_112226 [Salvia splendens]|uniref:Enolpyruvate transferase domain-containing protein n=1 Tax=Salvia splendens TaxID=180675 RepID=A0A8X9A4D4_SALSN|nr:hypothetical protein SASPL_112226 [Salvia splendens]
MAKMAHNLASPKFSIPNAKSPASTSSSLLFAPKTLNNSSKGSWVLGKGSILTVKKTNQLRVVASVATAEKPSTVPEIVLQPIKEISGTVKLPGSKSLSNRILLLAALSEHYVNLAKSETRLDLFQIFNATWQLRPRILAVIFPLLSCQEISPFGYVVMWLA